MSSLISIEDAHQFILDQVDIAPSHTVSLEEVLGLTLRTEIISQQSSPLFDKSLMDGYAVRTVDLQGPTVSLKVLEMVSAGEVGEHRLGREETIQIMTGAPLPVGADAVIPVEMSERESGEPLVHLQTAGIDPEKNLIRKGTILQPGQKLLSSGRVIRPAEVALLAELGISEVDVSIEAVVSILATGDELVATGESLGPGQIRNSNAPMLMSQVQRAGGISRNIGIGRDQLDELLNKVTLGLEANFLLLSGGVSAGEKDLVPQVLKECGVREIFHKVHVKPGKPLWFGVLEKSTGEKTYVFGLPGNPVSSMLCFEVFVRPAIRQFLGQERVLPRMRKLPLSKAHVAAGGRPTYYPSQLVSQADGLAVEPVDWKGSSDLLAPTRADAWICFPAGNRKYSIGEIVDVYTPDW
ncbi:MAG: molybdopterin molybdotransferase MoeA [Planctomycetaceae bacterium]|jgi:molybdopterin molybdotransferase|nr:molybdopterin molybdotransferase MoeA [Planctomycetaceae bacterium]MDG2389862.1 molybdopterin molybdotransferase MoeA [Planctomycetaceae bacterium]